MNQPQQSMKQQTLKSVVKLEGIGLHSGKISNVKLLPAEENNGIVFKRVDLKEKNIIKADYNNISSTVLCSTLKNFSGTKEITKKTKNIHSGKYWQ